MKGLNLAKHIVIGVACVILIVGMIIGDVMASIYFRQISNVLGQRTFRTEETEGGEEIDSQYYKSEFDLDTERLRTAQRSLVEQIQSEGAVLLKRGDLPMATSGAITIMGAGSGADTSTGFLYGGGGSGSIASDEALNLREIFEEKNYTVNPVMWDYYNTGAGKGNRDISTGRAGEQPISSLEGTAAADSVARYNDAAVVVIGRPGAEANDLPFTMAEDPSRHSLELSPNELDLIEWADEHFDQTIVLLNTMQAIELRPILDMDISVLWIGAAGEGGAAAIPDVLNGTVSPSGRTVDTWMNDMLANDPAVVNQGRMLWGETEESASDQYYVYAENIYVGYRYYETRYADVVANEGNPGDYDYDAVVDFPFGYGESYTEFEYSGFSVDEDADNVIVTVTVTNTGDRAGREVVQVYMRSPYTDFDRENGIEKEAVKLVGFEKTKTLTTEGEGSSEVVTVTVPKENMRVYDAEVNETYIVEAGDYDFAVGRNAHDALNNILASDGHDTDDGMTANGNALLVGTIVQEETDTETYSVGENGERITNRLQDADIRTYDADFEYLTRSDWTGTFPETYGGEDRVFAGTAEMIAALEVPDPESSFEDSEMPVTGANNGLTLASMIGLPYDHESWDMLLDQLTFDDMSSLIAANFGNAGVTAVQKPPMLDTDGPAGITSSLGVGTRGYGYPVEVLVASTWDKDLAYRQGELVGEDALATLANGWYAPGVNIHRSPFSGRNFEYYSEDSFLSGEFAGNVIAGANTRGVYSYMKHFALNDQEMNRVLAASFATEQTARQIYFAPFETAVRNYGATAMMLAMNRIGLTWVGHNKDIVDGIVRGEWGFNGIINTDTMGLFGTDINDTAIAAGLDCFLSVETVNEADFSDPDMMMELREAAHHILYVTANSKGMNGFTANTRIVDIIPPWTVGVIILSIVVIGGALVGFVFNILRTIRNMKNKEVEA